MALLEDASAAQHRQNNLKTQFDPGACIFDLHPTTIFTPYLAFSTQKNLNNIAFLENSS